MRWLAGLLLVGAALLKTLEVYLSPATTLTHSFGRGFVPAQIGAELALGMLILSGIYWLYVRWFAIALFVTFAGYSLYLAIGGAASCGCFGPVRVNPWWTFTLDVLVASGLVLATVIERRSIRVSSGSTTSVLANANSWPRGAVIIATSAAVFVIAVIGHLATRQVSLASGQLASNGDLVILEPEKWIGGRLPIANSIDVDLSEGTWVVLLHRHDCSVCREQVPLYEERAVQGEHVALIEVPPYGGLPSKDGVGLYGRLQDGREWFVQTPVELRLDEGIVVAVKTHEH